MDNSYDAQDRKIIGVRPTKDESKIPRTERKLLADDYNTMYPNRNGRGLDSWILGKGDESPMGSSMPTMTQSEVMAVEGERRSRKEEESKLERILTNLDTRIIYIHANGAGYKEDQIILGYGNGHESEKLDITMSGFVDLFNRGQRSNATSFPRPVDLSTKEQFLQTLKENDFNGKTFEGNKLRVIYPIDIHYKSERMIRVTESLEVQSKAESFFKRWKENQDNLVELTLGHDGNDLKTIRLKFVNEDIVVLPFEVFKGLTDGTMLGGQNGMLKATTDTDTVNDVLKSIKIDGVMINQRADVRFRDLRN